MEREPTAQTPPEFRPPEHQEPLRIPDYQLLRRIGRGSYGEVWLARSVTGAYRAVKVVHRSAFDHDRPFEREFSGILKFEPISRKHDSQLDILHVGRGGDYFFYVMELADDPLTGQQVNPDSYAPRTLKSELLHRGKLPFEECVRISLSLTTALENLHSQGLVHRDIKPSNVVFVNGVAKLADIGLVTGVDATRSFVGTEGFVPPEGPGTPQADIYSLGKMLYEVSTGKDRQEFPELPSDLDAWPEREGMLELNAVIAKACREDHRQRYASAEAMHRDLLLLQSGKSLARLHAAERALAKVKRTALVAGAVVLVLAAGLGLAAMGWRQARIERDEALHARAAEEALRKTATDSRERSRRLLYDSDMYLAQEEIQGNDLGRGRQLLDRHRPQPGEEDLRGWEWRYLWQLTRSGALATLTNRAMGGWSVSFSPDGSRLAVGWIDGRIDLWDVPGRRWIRTITKGADSAGHAVFSPVGHLLAATSGPNKVSLYDLDAGRESILWDTTGQGEWHVRDLEFSRDGSKAVIYAGSYTQELGDAAWVVNVSSAKIESRHAASYSYSYHFGAAQFSPDHQRLYMGRSDRLNNRCGIQCLDLATDKEVWRSDAVQDSGVTTLAISPDGRVLASASGFEDPSIRLWDAATGRLLDRLRGHTRYVCKLAFSKDGQRLISSSADESIRIWDTGTWAEAKVLRGHRAGVKAFAISPSGNLLASVSGNGELMLWNDNGSQANDGYLRLPKDLLGVMPLEGSRVMLIPPKGSPELFDLRQGVSLGSMPGLGALTNATVCGFGNHWLCRWDGAKEILVDQWNGSRFARLGAVTLDSGSRPIKAAFNAAREFVAWTEPTTSNSLFLATIKAPARRMELKSEIAGLLPDVFSDDGKYLAAVSPEGAGMCVWDVDRGERVVASSDEINAEAFALGGRVLVAAFYAPPDGHEIRFYDLDQPNHAPRRIDGRNEPHALTVSPDGQLVAASTDDGLVRLFDSVAGRLIADIPALNRGVAFSKDAQRLISAGGGPDAVKLLDVGTRQDLLKLSATGPVLQEALWSADGDTIVVGTPWHTKYPPWWQAWHAPSWEEIAVAEAKEKAEARQP